MGIKRIIYALTFIVVFQNCASKKNEFSSSISKSKWTEKDKQDFAFRNRDSTHWSYKKLKGDIERSFKRTSKKYPISDYPSPVKDYSGNGSTLSPLRFKLNGNIIKGWTVAHYRDKYNEHLFKDEKGEYHTFFNLLYLSNKDNQSGRAQVISRNYPHYFTTGTYKTSLGDIDWVQMTLANNDNFALVTQRYFDLSQGRTILVVPITDGSIRFLQIKDSPETFTSKTKAEFIKRLKSNMEVLTFFSRKDALKN